MRQEDKAVELELRFRCDAEWEDMEGDARVRHCYTCDKKVHNVSAMTALEAERFFETHRGQEFCAHATVDERGIIQHVEPGPPQRPIMPPRLTLGAATLTLPMLLAGCMDDSRYAKPSYENHSYDSYKNASNDEKVVEFCRNVRADRSAPTLYKIRCMSGFVPDTSKPTRYTGAMF